MLVDFIFLSIFFIPFFSLITSERILTYISIPTESIKPDCWEPNISPAPLIDKSFSAILYPDPKEANSLIAFNLFSASGVNSLFLL